VTRLLPAVALSLAVGCVSSPPGPGLPAPVVAAFDKADEVTLYALQPDNPPVLPEERDPAQERFYDHPVIGKSAVKDAAARQALFDAFRRGVRDHDGSVAGCFIPRHGLRITSGEKTVDLVICFECRQVLVYENDKRGPGMLISGSPRGAFNKALRDAGVPVPKGAE
jgi:hypothetical protein